MWYYILGFCGGFMQIHKRNAFLIYTYSGRKDQICLLRKTQVYKMLHYIIIFRINLQRCLYLLLCNLFHKVAVMNFMFPKHCHITLLWHKCKTSLLITLDIYFLGKTLLLITARDLPHKPGIMSLNVPTNLFWNSAQIWIRNAFSWPMKTLKVLFLLSTKI